MRCGDPSQRDRTGKTGTKPMNSRQALASFLPPCVTRSGDSRLADCIISPARPKNHGCHRKFLLTVSRPFEWTPAYPEWSGLEMEGATCPAGQGVQLVGVRDQPVGAVGADGLRPLGQWTRWQSRGYRLPAARQGGENVTLVRFIQQRRREIDCSVNKINKLHEQRGRRIWHERC